MSDLTKRLILRSLAWYAGIGALLFISAGTLRWPAGWVFTLEMLVSSVVIGAWLARCNPDLLRERLEPLSQKEQAFGDKVIMAVIAILCIVWLPLMALDAVRYRLSDVPLPLQIVGALGVLFSLAIGFLVLRENTFAAPVVKMQEQRGHAVISSGPYRYVRHRMYAGALGFFFGAPLLLGSWYGLIVGAALTVLLAMRIVVEERMLETNLAGYRDYQAHVRYRLVPLIW